MNIIQRVIKNIRNILFACVMGLFFYPAHSVLADEPAAPEPYPVYGGRITDISVIKKPGETNISRIFISTESANSVFYADVDHAQPEPFGTNNFAFQVVPDLDANAGYGVIQGMSSHEASGRLFISLANSLFSCGISAGSVITNITNRSEAGHPVNFNTLLIKENTLLAVGTPGMDGTNLLFFGALNTNGVLTEHSDSPISLGFSGRTSTMAVNPINNRLYVLDSTGTNGIMKSSSAYDDLSAATTFAKIPLPPAHTNWISDSRLGIGPDERLFLGASVAPNDKVILYSDDDGKSWTEVATGVGGTAGSNIETRGAAAPYDVYFGTAASTNSGADGSWDNFPLGGTSETHPNDGAVRADPVNTATIYMTTDQGIGASTNAGVDLFEINQGVEAVQIQDFDMTDDEMVAWTASKSGIRRAGNFKTNPEWLQTGIFPMDDGSPYYSIAVDRTVEDGSTVYACNARIYKTTDNGTNWNRLWSIDGNTNGFQDGGYFAAIVAHGDFVAAGFHGGEWSGANGGLLISHDGGANWNQVILHNDGVNVNDLLMNEESPGEFGVYVGVAYDAATGIGGVFYVNPDLTFEHLLNEEVSIRKFTLDSDGTVYASGQATDYSIVILRKGDDDDDVPTDGLPEPMQILGDRGPVMTVGKDADDNDILILAVGVQLYILPHNGNKWVTSNSLKYPEGTKINALYWDELVVGTDTGIFGHDIDVPLSGGTISDFNGDGRTDYAVFCQNTGLWFVLSADQNTILTWGLDWGWPGALPVPGDFNGDGRTDYAVFCQNTGLWFVFSADKTTLLTWRLDWGWQGALPVPGDFNGDGRTDYAVFCQNTGLWFVLSADKTTLLTWMLDWGWPGAWPVPGDFNGDGRTDYAVFCQNSGNWFVLSANQNTILAWGLDWGWPGAWPLRPVGASNE